MPRLPRAGWLAVGALVAAQLTASDRIELPPWLVLSLALLALAAAVVTAARRRAEVTALLIAFGTVSLRAGVAATLAMGAPAAAPLEAGSGAWEGAVSDVSSPAGAEQRAFVSLRAPDGGEWLVYAWLPRHPALVPGDAIEVRGQLQAPPADAPGFASFLQSRGAAGTLKGHRVRLVGSRGGVTAAVEGLRWGLDQTLSRAIPEPEAGLASGILIGLRERVSRATADDFTITGLTHVVAISGWNIALVAGIATALLRSTGLGRRPRSAIVVIAIVAYTILAGAEASVVRAAVMGGVVIIARESGRPSGAAAALGLACWGLLLAQPTMIDDIGLQLSLAATAGLLALGGPAEAAVRRVTGARGPRWFGEALGVSLAAQLSTLPLILLHFGRLSLISPLANLLVAPVVPLAMLGAAIGTVTGPLIVGPLSAMLLGPLLVAAWLPLVLMTRGAELLAQVPLATVELLPPLDLVGAGVALVALVVALRQATAATSRPHAWSPPRPPSPPRRRRAPAAVLVVALVAATSVALVARPTPALRVSVLDVGQGDAILLEANDGTRLLVDGGPDPDLLVRRLDERIPAWDRHIDLILLTHPHEDHAGGLAGLTPRYRVDRLIETDMNSEGSGVLALRAAAIRQGMRRIRLTQGDAFTLGQARVEVLWPPLDAIPDRILTDGRAINGTSIVLAVSLGRQRILLTGDLEDDHDADLLAVIPDDGRRWDLLKVAHHGSATASSRPLLAALRPRLAAVSSGHGNRYGHPAPATLQRLQQSQATVWRTDHQGTLSAGFEGRPRSATEMLAGPAPPICPSGRSQPTSATTSPADPCYIRPDGGTHPNRSALPARVDVAFPTPASAHDGRGGGGLLPRLPRLARGPRGRPAAGGNGRAPPRRGQGPRAEPPAQGARARRRRRGLAGTGRSPGAGALAHRPPRHPLHGAGCGQLAGRGTHRGAHRHLRRQARHAARGLAGTALRSLAAQAPRVPHPARPRLRHGTAPRADAVHGHRHRGHGRGTAALGR